MRRRSICCCSIYSNNDSLNKMISQMILKYSVKGKMKSLDYEINESNVVGTQNILSQMGNFLKEQMHKTLVVYKFFNYKSNKNDKNKNNN